MWNFLLEMNHGCGLQGSPKEALKWQELLANATEPPLDLMIRHSAVKSFITPIIVQI